MGHLPQCTASILRPNSVCQGSRLSQQDGEMGGQGHTSSAQDHRPVRSELYSFPRATTAHYHTWCLLTTETHSHAFLVLLTTLGSLACRFLTPVSASVFKWLSLCVPSHGLLSGHQTLDLKATLVLYDLFVTNDTCRDTIS